MIGWFNQDYFKEQYYWHAVMGPNVLTAAEERALKPGDQFTECGKGCPTMVVIPAGTFTMGSPAGEGQENERPQHERTIAQPFAVGKYELTFAEWDACATAGSCPPLPDGGWGRDARPVINVSWKEAKDYLTWLSKVTGKTYRLLTEDEWEYAARGEQPRGNSLAISLLLLKMLTPCSSRTPRLSSMTMLGTSQMRTEAHTRSAKRNPTPSGSTMSMEMRRSGLKTRGVNTLAQLRRS